MVAISSIYGRVDMLRSNGNVEVANKFRAALDELNLDIFLRVTNYCEDKDYLIDERTIEKFVIGIINEFNPKFLQIDNLINP